MVGNSSGASGVLARRFLSLLGLYARRTPIQNGMFVCEARNALDVLVCVVKVIVAGMAKTLVPEKSLSFSLDRSDRCVLLYIFVKRHAMEE